MVPCGFEFISDKSETQEPCSEGVALIIGYCGLRRSVFLNKRLMIYRKAKLDICLYFACMSGRIEESKFHRSLCKSSMKVQTMISASVIVSGSVFIASLLSGFFVLVNVYKMYALVGNFDIAVVHICFQTAVKLPVHLALVLP